MLALWCCVMSKTMLKFRAPFLCAAVSRLARLASFNVKCMQKSETRCFRWVMLRGYINGSLYPLSIHLSQQYLLSTTKNKHLLSFIYWASVIKQALHQHEKGQSREGWTVDVQWDCNFVGKHFQFGKTGKTNLNWLTCVCDVSECVWCVRNVDEWIAAGLWCATCNTALIVTDLYPWEVQEGALPFTQH